MILTIGHSSRPVSAFIALLRAHQVIQLADVRRVPKSARHPQYGREALAAVLASHGIVYRHFQDLGGMRKPQPASVNTALREASFRGYADYMQTEAFHAALLDLLQFAGAAPTAIMCAEAGWQDCHRKLLSDTLLVRGVQVRHILSTSLSKGHELSDFARPSATGVIYPGLL